MGQSGQLVFEYFFYAGSGVGIGLVVTIGGALLIYKKLKGVNFKWLNRTSQSSGQQRQSRWT